MGELVGEQVRVLGGAAEEVVEAVLGVVGQRVDVADAPAGCRRSRAAGGPRRACGRCTRRRPAAGARGRAARPGSAVARAPRRCCATPRSMSIGASVMLGERVEPDGEDGVGGDHGVAQVAGLVAVEALGLDRGRRRRRGRGRRGPAAARRRRSPRRCRGRRARRRSGSSRGRGGRGRSASARRTARGRRRASRPPRNAPRRAAPAAGAPRQRLRHRGRARSSLLTPRGDRCVIVIGSVAGS